VRFERRQLVTDDARKTCPECGGEVHRIIHPAGIVFRGKGFYATDMGSMAQYRLRMVGVDIRTDACYSNLDRRTG
jgi:putative FmdB family regulatory protein